MDAAGLVAAGYLPPAVLSAADPGSDPSGFARVSAAGTYNYDVSVDAGGTCFTGVARSGTGTVYYSTNQVSDPQELTPTTVTGCATVESTQTLAAGVGGYPAKYIPAAPSAPATQTVTSSGATFTWNAVEGATGYRVEYRINGGAWIVLADNQAGTTAIVPAPGSSTVDVRVSAGNAAGTSSASQVMSAVLPAADTYTWAGGAASVTNYSGMTTNADGSIRVYAAGSNLMLSKDSGKTWSVTGASVPKGQYTSWDDPQIVCNSRITAYGGTTQYFSTNAGGSYTSESVGSPCSIPAVKSSDGKWKISTTEAATYHNGFYVTYDPTISFTGAAGTKTKTITNSYQSHSQRVRSVAVDEDGLRAAYLTTSNSITATTDGGVTWVSLNPPGAGSVTFSAMASDAKRFAVIKGGQLYTTVDSGTTWKLETNAGTGLTWVGFSADGKTLTSEKNGTRYTGTFG
jgi:hypothetical protein